MNTRSSQLVDSTRALALRAGLGRADRGGSYAFAGSTSPSGSTAFAGSGARSGPTAITRLNASRSYIVTKGHRARSKNATNPLAIAILGAAILMLGLAALPAAAIPDPRLTDVLVRHRAEVVVAGAAAFVAGVLALTFG